MLLRESFAQRSHHYVIAKTLYGPDGRAVAAASVRDAGASRNAIDLNRAGTTDAMLAADMRAGQHQPAAQQIGKMLARFRLNLRRLAVHGERDGDSAHGPFTA